MFRQVLTLIQKDMLTEWRQRYALNGILLHVVASVMVVYLSVKVMNAPTWNAIFWLILLFTSVSAVAKSFISESRGRSLYYYGLVSAQALILSRVFYNMALMFLMAIISLGVYIVVLGNPVGNMGIYALCTVLGCMGFAITFTLLSSIAAKAGHSSLLMPVLSFPVIVPLFLVLIKASKKAMDDIDISLIIPDLIILLLLNALVLSLAYVLFPFLHKE
jgi:heme exporter protein B